MVNSSADTIIVVELDYRTPTQRQVERGQLWVGIVLWLLLAELLAIGVYTLYSGRHDPSLGL
jgi:hypothetical protein